MWFEDYDEFMLFSDLHQRAVWSKQGAFEYNGVLHSCDMASAVINEVNHR